MEDSLTGVHKYLYTETGVTRYNYSRNDIINTPFHGAANG